MANLLEDERATAIFRALSDPTRRQVLMDLARSDLPAGRIGTRFPISGPSVSRHLAVLKAAGIVKQRRDANRLIYSLSPTPLVECLYDFLASIGYDLSEKVSKGADVKAKGSGKAKTKTANKGKRRAKAAKHAAPTEPIEAMVDEQQPLPVPAADTDGTVQKDGRAARAPLLGQGGMSLASQVGRTPVRKPIGS